MEHSKVKKILFSSLAVAAAFLVYTFCINTGYYKIDYINYDDQFNPKEYSLFVLSNPPKDKLDELDFLNSKINWLLEFKRDYTIFLLVYSERFYFNRFFSTLNYSGVPIGQLINEKDNSKYNMSIPAP
jgi:hypothetical protein